MFFHSSSDHFILKSVTTEEEDEELVDCDTLSVFVDIFFVSLFALLFATLFCETKILDFIASFFRRCNKPTFFYPIAELFL